MWRKRNSCEDPKTGLKEILCEALTEEKQAQDKIARLRRAEELLMDKLVVYSDYDDFESWEAELTH